MIVASSQHANTKKGQDKDYTGHKNVVETEQKQSQKRGQCLNLQLFVILILTEIDTQKTILLGKTFSPLLL